MHANHMNAHDTGVAPTRGCAHRVHDKEEDLKEFDHLTSVECQAGNIERLALMQHIQEPKEARTGGSDEFGSRKARRVREQGGGCVCHEGSK